MRGVPVEYFEEYGTDADAALAAMANVDPDLWSEFVDRAARELYLSQRTAWVRAQVTQVAITDDQIQLFSAAQMKSLTVRKTVVTVIDGRRCEFETLDLAGEEGAAILEGVADRDERPAKTTVRRAKDYRKLAKIVREKSASEQRPVSVREVLEGAA